MAPVEVHPLHPRHPRFQLGVIADGDKQGFGRRIKKHCTAKTQRGIGIGINIQAANDAIHHVPRVGYRGSDYSEL